MLCLPKRQTFSAEELSPQEMASPPENCLDYSEGHWGHSSPAHSPWTDCFCLFLQVSALGLPHFNFMWDVTFSDISNNLWSPVCLIHTWQPEVLGRDETNLS